MKASIFIKTALIDQMQQIADLGLWFHLAKLIPSGVDVLARVRYGNKLSNDISIPDDVPSHISVILTNAFYAEFAPKYSGKHPTSKEFFSSNPNCFLTSNPSDAEKHLSKDENGMVFIHVPQWFEDFKIWCEAIVVRIESDFKEISIEDIEVLKTVYV